MGRHSRGAGEPPAPLPDPPTRHPYAPRSVDDTGDRDRRSYRVVDVGLPTGAPGVDPGDVRRDGRPSPPRRRAHGATRADLAASSPPPHHPPAEAPELGARANSRVGGPTADPRELRRDDRPDPAQPRFRAPTDRPEPRFGGPDPTESRFGAATTGVGEPRVGATRADPAESRFRPPTPDPAEPRVGATRADLAESRFRPPTPDPAESRVGATRADLAGSRFGGSAAGTAESRFGASRLDPGQPYLPAPAADPAASRFGAGRPEFAAPGLGVSESRSAAPGEQELAPVRPDLAESRFGATRADLPEPRPGRREEPAGSRFGATRADLAESVGSTALAPRPAPDPDEVTDTGARRARSAFRLAAETDEADRSDDHDDHDEDEHDEREPALILQWGIFVAQTLTGAIAGLGVWLGFYRLWSTWPFYAVPAVGVAAVAMLVLARALRRRHGRDLDLLTAVVTAGIITVLTVLPAAFTLQGLAQ